MSDDLLKATQALLDAAPRHLQCEDFHHTRKERHDGFSKCPPLITYYTAIENAVMAIKKARGEE